MCYSVGIGKVLGPMGVFPLYFLTIITFGGMIMSIDMSLFYRVTRLYPNDALEEKKTWVKLGVGVLMLFEVMLFGKCWNNDCAVI